MRFRSRVQLPDSDCLKRTKQFEILPAPNGRARQYWMPDGRTHRWLMPDPPPLIALAWETKGCAAHRLSFSKSNNIGSDWVNTLFCTTESDRTGSLYFELIGWVGLWVKNYNPSSTRRISKLDWVGFF